MTDALQFWRVGPGVRVGIGDKSAERLGHYLWVLDSMALAGTIATTSADVARKANVSAALVRKDLARLGQMGTRGSGYEVATLLRGLRHRLGLSEPMPAAWIGAPALRRRINVARILARYDCPVVAVFDDEASERGEIVQDLKVRPMSALPGAATSLQLGLGVVAVDGQSAQAAAEALVRAGVTRLLNLGETPLAVPSNVVVENLSVSARLASLLARSAGGPH
ncbi:MAG: redox-sensing transcriptional repressor Rex [Armatimonadota bacterium]